MIIGITGTLGAGKGTVVEFLLKKGFKHYSVRDFLTKEIEKRGWNVSRDTMVTVANDLREKYGSGYIVEQLYLEAKRGGENGIIESIRSVGEVEFLRNIGNSVLLAVDCDRRIRYARICERSSVTDNVSYDEFVSQEEREMSSSDKTKGNLRRCIEESNYVLMNNGTLDELAQQVEDVLEKIRRDEEVKSSGYVDQEESPIEDLGEELEILEATPEFSENESGFQGVQGDVVKKEVSIYDEDEGKEDESRFMREDDYDDDEDDDSEDEGYDDGAEKYSDEDDTDEGVGGYSVASEKMEGGYDVEDDSEEEDLGGYGSVSREMKDGYDIKDDSEVDSEEKEESETKDDSEEEKVEVSCLVEEIEYLDSEVDSEEKEDEEAVNEVIKESDKEEPMEKKEEIVEKSQEVVVALESVSVSTDEGKEKEEEVGEKIEFERPSWDEYFLEVMESVAKRATCDRGRSGCVIVKDKHILVTGYVGSPVGLPHCDEVGHQMKQMVHEDGHVSNHCVRTAHAEQNAICQAAKLGIPLEGSTMYCNMTPCAVCAKMVINSGIKKVVARKKYHAGGESIEMFKEAGVELSHVYDELEKYKGQ